MTNCDNFDQLWQFWPVLATMTNFDKWQLRHENCDNYSSNNPDNYDQLWIFVKVINNCEFLWQLGRIVTILTILPLVVWVWHPVSHVFHGTLWKFWYQCHIIFPYFDIQVPTLVPTKRSRSCTKVMRKRLKTSAKGISGLLVYTMEHFVLYKIEVVAAPMVRSELRYWAFPDGLFTWISDWILAENSNPKQARHIFPEIWILFAILVKQRKFNLPGKSAWLAWDLNFPPNLMSYQSEIQVKMAFFNPKYHAPETSEGSESGSILLARVFYIW